MTREQRKQRGRRVASLLLAVLFVAAICVARCFACSGEALDGTVRTLTVVGAFTVTWFVMRALFWLDSAK